MKRRFQGCCYAERLFEVEFLTEYEKTCRSLAWEQFSDIYYICIYIFLHVPQRIFKSRLRVREVPRICEINISTEVEWLQSPRRCIFPTIWLADRPLLFTHPIHFYSGDCAGMIWVGRNAADNSVSEVLIRRPIFLFTFPPCRPFFHFPLLPTRPVVLLSLSPSRPPLSLAVSLPRSLFIFQHQCARRQLIAGKCQKANCWCSLRLHTATVCLPAF